MRESLSELLVETATLVFDLLVVLVLTVAGLEAELHSITVAQTDTLMALWFGYMGLVALYAGVVVVGGGRLLPRLRARYESGQA